MASIRFPLSILFLTCSLGSWAQDEKPTIPDAKKTWAEIERVLEEPDKVGRKPSLGLVLDAIFVCLSYAGAIYDEGDVSGCAAYYAKTARAISAEFDRPDATAGCKRAVARLKLGLDRAQALDDAEQTSWILRYQFDRIAEEWESRAVRGLVRAQLGEVAIMEGDLDCALEIYGEVEGEAAELLSSSPHKDRPEALRWDESRESLAGMHFGRAHALLAKGELEKAAEIIGDGLLVAPEWPTCAIDLKALYGDRYAKIADDLASAAKKNPDAEFLLGYLLYYGGERKQAEKHFAKASKTRPGHPASRIYQESLR